MSDSTPKPNGIKPDATTGLSGVTPGAGSLRWWIASLGFHAALVVWLLFFSPVRVIDTKAKPAASHVSAAQARQVVDAIREKQAVTMEQNLRTLEDIGKKISDLENQKRDEFKTFARELGKDVPAKAAADEQDIARIQAEALAALDQSTANATLYVKTRANAQFDDLRDTQKLAREKQNRVLQLQEQAQGLLSLGDARFAAAQSAMNEASAAQDRAAKALADAETASDAARGSRKRTAHEGQIDHFTYHLRRTREIVVTGATNLVVAQRRVAINEAVLARRQTIADEAVKKVAAENTDTARAMAQAAKRSLTSAEKELAWARRLEGEVPKEIADAKKSLPELVTKVAQLLAEPDPERPAPTAEDRKFIEQQTAARQLQVEAQQAQAKAAQAIAAIQGLKNDSAAGTDALTALDKAAPAEAAPPAADPKHMNLAQMYSSALRTESRLTQSYRRLRAMNLALIRRVPLAKAIDLTEVAKPVRPDLAAGLQASIESGEDAVAAREAVQSAKTEVGAMVRLADSLLSQAHSVDAKLGASISLEEYSRQFDELQAMENMATEEAGQWDVDLTAMMGGGGEGSGQGGEGEGGGEGGGGEGGGGEGGGGQGSGGSGRGGSGGKGGPGGSGNGGSGLPNLGVTGIAGPFRGAGNGAGSGGTGAGNGTGAGGVAGGVGSGVGPGGHGGFGMGGIKGAPGEIGRPENVSDRVLPAPGRRVAARGGSGRWLYADSWYVLGPFDNSGRRNIDKKFPPETVIDLNATYPGKNGVQIHWEFQQSGTPNVAPHLDAYNAAVRDPSVSPAANADRNRQYVIYYAYTELWFEQAADLWVAIGSDDFSKVWIEDKLVWSSGKNLKAWQLNEGLRKVHFKKGINRVLYRVENGNSLTEFSLVVSLMP